MAEQFALQEGLRQCAAAHLDKGLALFLLVTLVYGMRNQMLACA